MYGRIVLLSFLIGIITVAKAQVVVVENYYYVLNDIDDKVLDELFLAVRKGVEKYDELADLLDEEVNAVSPSAVDDFENLFLSDALIFSDITKETYSLTYENYTQLIREYLSNNGVNFDIRSMIIDGISYDENGFYLIDVLTRKYLFNGIDERQSPFYCKSGRTFNLKFTFKVSQEDLSSAKIAKIEGSLLKECEDKAFTITPISAVSIGKVRYDEKAFFTNTLNSLKVEFAPLFSWNVGLKVQKSLTKQNNLFVNSGIIYSQMHLRSNWNGFFNYDTEDIENVTFNKTFQLSNGVERTKLQWLEVPLGLKIRLKEYKNFYFFIEPYAQFGLTINNSNQRTITEGELVSYGIYPDESIESYNIENGLIVPDKIYTNSSTNQSEWHLSTGLNLSSQYTINSSIAIEVGLNYQYGITPLLNDFSEENNYPDNVLLENNFTETYLYDLKSQHFGIQIGIVIKP